MLVDWSFVEISPQKIFAHFVTLVFSENRQTLFTEMIQGVSSGFDLMYLTPADRNMQVRFGLKVVWES